MAVDLDALSWRLLEIVKKRNQCFGSSLDRCIRAMLGGYADLDILVMFESRCPRLTDLPRHSQTRGLVYIGIRTTLAELLKFVITEVVPRLDRLTHTNVGDIFLEALLSGRLGRPVLMVDVPLRTLVLEVPEDVAPSKIYNLVRKVCEFSRYAGVVAYLNKVFEDLKKCEVDHEVAQSYAYGTLPYLLYYLAIGKHPPMGRNFINLSLVEPCKDSGRFIAFILKLERALSRVSTIRKIINNVKTL